MILSILNVFKKLKNICLLIIISILASCSSKETSKENAGLHLSKTRETNALIKSEDQQSPNKNAENILELPILGTFDLKNESIERTNKYGGGDCSGKITKYSIPDGALAVDSLSCGDYGYTYTYYLLSPEDLIMAIFTRKSQPFLTKENNYDGYLIKEQVIDFNAKPSYTMTKTDNFPDLLNKTIDKPFENETLNDWQKAYQHWEQEYQGHWQIQKNP